MSLKKATFIIILILLIDQISKFYIKTSFVLGEEIRVFDWFRILFVENEGMAWGAKIPGEYGKLFLCKSPPLIFMKEKKLLRGASKSSQSGNFFKVVTTALMNNLFCSSAGRCRK